jgi:hypothetical protein
MPPPPPEPPDWWSEEPASPPAEAPTQNFLFETDPVPAGSGSNARGNDQIRIRLGGIPFVITGGSFQQMLATIKSLPGRRFHSEDKVWDIPADMTIDAFQKRMAEVGLTVQRG